MPCVDINIDQKSWLHAWNSTKKKNILVTYDRYVYSNMLVVHTKEVNNNAKFRRKKEMVFGS